MAYLSLYRKYRSQSFEEIVGQEHIITTLKNAVSRDRIAHAYLFSGPRGTGKTSTARIMAKCINCENGPTPTPCNVCPVCTAIAGDRLFDVIEIDAASNRGIDDVRDLKEKVRVPPTQARKKVYIIDEVHMLTREAFNALLKTLEEPPAHVVFIMATTEPQKLPATILSRCQRFDFRRITDAEIAGHIRNIAQREQFEIDPVAADMIIKTADGSLRDSISILDQLVSFTDGRITGEDALQMFGLVEHSDIIRFMEAIGAGDTAAAFDLFRKFFDAGKSFSLFLRLILEYLRDIYFLRQGLTPPRGTYSEQELVALKKRAAATPRQTIVALMDETARVEDRIRWEVYPRIILEILIVKMIDIVAGGGAAAAAPEAVKKSASRAKPATAEPAASTQPVEPEPPPATTVLAAADQATAGQAVPSPKIPDMPPPEESLPEEPPDHTEDTRPENAFTPTWNAMLAEIKKKHLPRFFIIADARPEITDANTLTLSYQPEHQFKMEQAREDSVIKLLQDLLKKHHGKSLRIKVRVDRDDPDAGENNHAPDDPAPPEDPAPPPEPAPSKAQNLNLFDELKEVFPSSVEIKED